MPIWLRRIIFWTFVLIFFISAPLLVLYTAGYRYNIQGNIVTRTGVISITSNPKNAEIYLNGESTGVSTPNVLKHVLSGEYFIELRKDNYKPWSGQINIESGKATTLKDIRLFLESDAELLFDKQIDDIAIDTSGETIVYTIDEGGWIEVWMYKVSSNTHVLLDRLLSDDNQITQISWSSNSSYLIVSCPQAYSISAYDKYGTTLGIPIALLIPDEILGVKWHPSTDQLLLITTKYGITQFDVQTQDIETFAQTDENSIIWDASILKLIENDDFTEIAQYINGNKETLGLLPQGEYTIKERDGSYIILNDNIGRLYLIEIHKDEPILLQEYADLYDWNSKEDMLIFSNGFELSVYDAKTHSIELITRQSDRINEIALHPDAGTIFIKDSSLKAFETYPIAKQRFETILLDNTIIDRMWVSQDGANIYFYGQQNGAYGVYKFKLSDTLSDINIF